MIEAKHIELLDEVYQVILQPDSWDLMLDRLAEEIGAYGINLWIGDRVLQELQCFWASKNIYASMDAYLQSGYAEDEKPLIESLPDISAETGILEINELVRLHNQSYSEQVNIKPLGDWLRNNYGVESRYLTSLNNHKGFYDCMNISFTQLGVQEQTERIDVCRFFIPHLSNIVNTARPFLLLKARFNAVLEVLDRFRLGVFILTPSGDVVGSNQSAEMILDNHDGIRLDNKNRLKFGDGVDQTQFQLHAHKLLTGSAESCRVQMSIQRSSYKVPYLLELSQVAYPDLPMCILAVVIDPEQKQHINTSSFSQLFALTPAEQQICQLLAEGFKARDIADIRNTGLETVRGQIKSVLAKTKTHNTTELIRLALTVNLPVDPTP